MSSHFTFVCFVGVGKASQEAFLARVECTHLRFTPLLSSPQFVKRRKERLERELKHDKLIANALRGKRAYALLLMSL